MNCTLIVAMDAHRGIGKANDLPWHLPRDMQFFKATTMHHTVVMGRKNWDSIPVKFRPLKNRKNIVLSRQNDFKAKGAFVLHHLDDLHNALEEDKKCFVIGGTEIFTQVLQKGWVNELYVTHIEHIFEADTFFPHVDWEDWNEEEILHFEKDEKNHYSFTIKRYFR